MKALPHLPAGTRHVLPIATLLLALSGCEQEKQLAQAEMTMPPPPVTVAIPVSREITDWDEFTGRLHAVESVEVRPRVSGYLESINFDEGSIVKKGDLLYVIDPRPYQARVEQSKAQIAHAQAALELTENELKRAKKLHLTKVISDEDMDIKENKKQEAVATLEAAKAEARFAQLNLEFTHIRSPIDGRISRTLVTEGNLVNGGDFESTLLTTIVSLDPIYVYFSADEQSVLHYSRLNMEGRRESSRISPNPVFLRLADEEEYMHKGHMDFVDNQMDPNTGTMRGRAIVENPDYLLAPGMFADVRLLGENPYNALLIPDSAIFQDQIHKFVYVVDENNTVERRQVTAGTVHDGLRVIREGLNQNDKVIINGLQRVQPGMQVAPEMGTIAASDMPQG